MKKIMKTTGKVVLAITAGVLMPVLIWVAFGVALHQKVEQKRTAPATVPGLKEVLTAK